MVKYDTLIPKYKYEAEDREKTNRLLQFITFLTNSLRCVIIASKRNNFIKQNVARTTDRTAG